MTVRPPVSDPPRITHTSFCTQTSKEAHFITMEPITDIATYLSAHAQEVGESPGDKREDYSHQVGGGTVMRVILEVSSNPRRDHPIGI
jgi:hypothetical protein